MSGNFYGGHMAFAMDALKAAIASVAACRTDRWPSGGPPSESRNSGGSW